MIEVVALDLSLRETGVMRSDGPGLITYKLPPMATETDRVKRLRYLGQACDRVCRGADVVVIEGHSFGSKNTHAHSLGELHGVVKTVLLQRGITFVVIPPTVLKKWATGRGNATKDQVLVAAVRDGFEGDNNNAADAFHLYRLTLAHYRNGDEIAPAYRAQVVRSIRWPDIEERSQAVG